MPPACSSSRDENELLPVAWRCFGREVPDEVARGIERGRLTGPLRGLGGILWADPTCSTRQAPLSSMKSESLRHGMTWCRVVITRLTKSFRGASNLNGQGLQKVAIVARELIALALELVSAGAPARGFAA
jgi:hypothetical protein